MSEIGILYLDEDRERIETKTVKEYVRCNGIEYSHRNMRL